MTFFGTLYHQAQHVADTTVDTLEVVLTQPEQIRPLTEVGDSLERLYTRLTSIE